LNQTDNAWVVANNKDYFRGHMLRWTKKPLL
jgi:hypothetical protein